MSTGTAKSCLVLPFPPVSTDCTAGIADSALLFLRPTTTPTEDLWLNAAPSITTVLSSASRSHLRQGGGGGGTPTYPALANVHIENTAANST